MIPPLPVAPKRLRSSFPSLSPLFSRGTPAGLLRLSRLVVCLSRSLCSVARIGVLSGEFSGLLRVLGHEETPSG